MNLCDRSDSELWGLRIRNLQPVRGAGQISAYFDDAILLNRKYAKQSTAPRLNRGAIAMAKKPPPLKPGQTVTDSGSYKAGPRRATMVKGEPAPPTPRAGLKWRQVVDTNPKN